MRTGYWPIVTKDEYHYKGYTIRRTKTTTNIKKRMPCESNGYYDATVRCFEIDGLKPVGMRPFIVSIIDAKRYINEHIKNEME